MFKKQHLALAIAATLAAGAAQAALETSVTLKNETAYMTSDSIRTGEATTRTDTTGEGKGVYKFENTAKIYLNDELANGASWHGELNIVRDTKAINDYQGHETNTQRDWLRELYVDTTVNDWDVRLGKQQVVWGTADGIKLLDMVNPTDWSEFNQNTMADSRIPVWMINAEKYLDNGGNIQFIVSQSSENKIAGLQASGDQGHPFIMKGVDSITGKVNGFLNIAPAMGQVARFFGQAGGGQLKSYKQATVSDFVNNVGASGVDATSTRIAASGVGEDAGDFFGLCGQTSLGTANTGSLGCLWNLSNDTNTILTGAGAKTKGSNNDVTNLIEDTSGWDVANANTAFELMDQATFSTFDSFANMTTEYRVKMPNDLDTNTGFRFRNTTDSGLNWSMNYFYHYDSNPYVELSWEDQSGNSLFPVYSNLASGDTVTLYDKNADGYTSENTNDATTTVYLTNAAGAQIDPLQNHMGAAGANAVANLVFTQKMNRIHSLGGSFDTTIDLPEIPLVLRGEFVYDKDVKTPVVDKAALRIGDIEKGLRNEEADMFKYVIGADVTVLTDMMLSGQFIQFRNLDYIDEKNRAPSRGGVTSNVTGDRYTADMPTLHLSNNLKKAEKNKEFYSLFLSKPFGDSGEGRWNNMFIYEEGGGKWNRFDVEYGFDDQLIGTFEVNKYFGDENTMFGQFENASNVQIGVKYLLQ